MQRVIVLILLLFAVFSCEKKQEKKPEETVKSEQPAPKTATSNTFDVKKGGETSNPETDVTKNENSNNASNNTAPVSTEAEVKTDLSEQDKPVPGKWYTTARLSEGKKLYNIHCLACHLPNGTGSPVWKPDTVSLVIAPPLNGINYAPNNPKSYMVSQIVNGNITKGGVMPAFGTRLKETEIESLVAYISSLWPKNVYEKWIGDGNLEK